MPFIIILSFIAVLNCSTMSLKLLSLKADTFLPALTVYHGTSCAAAEGICQGPGRVEETSKRYFTAIKAQSEKGPDPLFLRPAGGKNRGSFSVVLLQILYCNFVEFVVLLPFISYRIGYLRVTGDDDEAFHGNKNAISVA